MFLFCIRVLLDFKGIMIAKDFMFILYYTIQLHSYTLNDNVNEYIYLIYFK